MELIVIISVNCCRRECGGSCTVKGINSPDIREGNTILGHFTVTIPASLGPVLYMQIIMFRARA